MKKIYLLGAASLLCFPNFAGAADDVKIAGSVELGLRVVDDHDNSAKFQEYRDRDDSVLGSIMLNTDKNSYYLDLTGKNIGLDDQFFKLKGGDRKNFNYKLFYNETPHNYSFGNRSIYNNPGASILTYNATAATPTTAVPFSPTVSADPNTWSSFDYTIERKDYGAKFNITLDTPFYLNFGAKQLETTGNKPFSQPSGVFVERFTATAQTSAFGNIVEMPEPIDYKTNDAFIELGYHSKTLMASLKAMRSDFENDNDYLIWRNPYVTSQSYSGLSSLAPDNDYWKVSFDGSMRLPMSSLLAVKASHAKLESDIDIINTIPSAISAAGTSPVYGSTLLGLSDTNFDGDVTYTKLGLSLSGRPLNNLFGKIYYNYLDKDNDSSHITFTNGTDTVTNHIFDYEKNNFGLDVDYKLPMKNKISLGYEYLDIDRERHDAESTDDHIGYIKWKNMYFDKVHANISYKHLERDSDFAAKHAGNDEFDVEYIHRSVRLFDATDKDQDSFKFGLDFYLTDNLDVAVEYTYNDNDYDTTDLGRTGDQEELFYVDFMWRAMHHLSLSGYAGYEDSNSDSNHRYISPSSGTNTISYDPTAGFQTGKGTSKGYNWSDDSEYEFLSYGLTANIKTCRDMVDLVISWRHEDADGENNFTDQDVVNHPDINDSDDFIRNLFEAKAVYKYAHNIDITLGYVYEKYEYEDIKYDDYSYTLAATNGINTFMTGAYADSEYEANLGYLTVKYNF